MVGPGAGAPSPPRGSRAARPPELVALTDPAALDAGLTGGKAAALAAAARAGLPTLPGAVLTTRFARAVDAGASVEDHPSLLSAFRSVQDQTGLLIARSSSVLEDTAGSSMAGQFESVAGVSTPAQLAVAVRAVLASRARVGADGSPIAILVQPQVHPRLGGVLFGVDPVSGRSDRLVVAAVRGSVEPLVSGAAVGSRYVVDRDGHPVERDHHDGPALRRSDLARLARLADRAAEVFGGPQDIEWAITADGRLWLLQSRPVTVEVRGVPRGPVYGPGPVAETFPEPLSELEEDLWLPPLREAVQAAVRLAGAVPRRHLAVSDAVVAVGGHVAVDLRLAGDLTHAPGSRWQRANPLPALRRLRGAWRVGRLRAALPHLADHLLERTDGDLRSVPALATLSDRQLVALLHRGRDVLRALHAHEILVGLLGKAGSSPLTGVGVALRVLAEARREGLSDQQIIERHPVVLALVPPRIGPRAELDVAVEPLPPAPVVDESDDDGVLREALRLRVRWVQELTARAAWELGGRLRRTGQVPARDLVRHVSLDDLDAAVTRRGVLVPALVGSHEHGEVAPLPARFRLSDTGQVIRVASRTEGGGGTGAGGGVGRGPVTHDAVDPPVGSVLVTTTLTPGIGPLLSRLEGIVAETGSVLSHLAILAREAGVATVVGYDGAVEDLPDGAVVTVDGDTGRVAVDAGAVRS